ncbi:MAG: hypothetical protein E5W99_03745 [Mesorhizobium sp.]|nr:MAG: hypothetical protein E5W99_03745 [Mesorhizobium sp.]
MRIHHRLARHRLYRKAGERLFRFDGLGRLEGSQWTPARHPDERLALHDLVERVAASCRRFKVDRLLIESKAAGISTAQEIRRLHSNEGYGVQLLDPKGGDKVARAYAVQHLFSDGMVFAPDRDWSDMVITEMGSFPRAPHDDLVDSAVQALKHLRDVGLLIHGAEMAQEIEEEMMHKPHRTQPLYPV